MGRKHILIVIAFLALMIGIGTVINAKKVEIFSREENPIDSAPQQDLRGNAKNLSAVPSSAKGTVPSEMQRAANKKSTLPTADSIPKGTRQKIKGDKVTACTPAYEDIMELNNNPSLVETLQSKVTEACVSELAKIINLEEPMKGMSGCGTPEDTEPEQADKCLRVASIFRTAFVENEFKGMDPSDIPSPVLRAMIVFRILQMESYIEKDQDVEYFYRLVSEEQRLSPEKDMSSLRSMLMGKLLESNPERYEHDFEPVMMEIERKNPQAALSARLARYNNNLTIPDLHTEVDEFIQRNPNTAFGYYVKAAIQAGREDWAGADSLMAKALGLTTSDKSFYQAERAKFASKKQGITVRHTFTTSL